MTDREAAWDAVYEALPAGWTVGPPTFDPGVTGWSVTARSVAASRRRPPQKVTGDRSRRDSGPARPGRPSPRRSTAQRVADGGTREADPTGVHRRCRVVVARG